MSLTTALLNHHRHAGGELAGWKKLSENARCNYVWDNYLRLINFHSHSSSAASLEAFAATSDKSPILFEL